MQNRRKYVVSGAFLALGLFLLIGIFYWFNVYSRKDYAKYKIIFSESVDGLAIHSAVRYNGVLVGYVNEIRLDRDFPSSIDVVISVDKSLKILNSTQATLKTQGITGLYYIGLKNLDNVKNPTKLESKNGEIPIIPSVQSLSSIIFDNTQKITDNLTTISTQATNLLTEQNLKNLSIVLENMATLSKKLVKNSDELSSSLQHFNELSKSLQDNSKNLNQVMFSVKKLSDNVLVTNNNVNILIKNFNDNTLSNFNNNLMPNLNQSTVSFNKNMLELQKTINMLNKNPSSLVKGLPSESYGPGEK